MQATRNYKCPLCANLVEVIDFESSGPVQCYFCDGHFRAKQTSPEVPQSNYVRKSRAPQRPVVQSASHLPYCSHCRTVVNPNVVSVNESTGGVILPTPIGAIYRPNSHTRLVKVCPFCGNQVFSPQDAAEEESAQRIGRILTVFWIVFPIAVVIMLIWLCNRPTD